MAVCPGCGKKLNFWNIKAECPHCGVNIPNYNWEERLEADAERSVWAFAKFKKHMSFLKSGLVGTKLSIVRLVFTFVPLIILVIPMFTLSLNVPFNSYQAKGISILNIILAVVNGVDIGAFLGLLKGEIAGSSFLLLAVGIVLVALAIVAAVINFFVLIIGSIKHKYVGNYVLCALSAALFIAAIPVFFVGFRSFSALGLSVFSGSVNAALYIGIVLFCINLALNIITSKHLKKLDSQLSAENGEPKTEVMEQETVSAS